MLLQTLNYPREQKKHLLERIEYYLQVEAKKIAELDNYEDTEIHHNWLCSEIDSIGIKLNFLQISLAVAEGQGCYEYP